MSEGLVHRTILANGSTTLLRAVSTGYAASEKADGKAISRLKRALSTRSMISTTSGIASRIQRAEDLRVIGLGSCGTVFEIPGAELAFKKGTNEDSIWRDFCLTNRVHKAAKTVRTILQEAFPRSTIPRTPQCHEFHLANDQDFWSANLQRFPADHRSKQPLFLVDRILPIPKQTRMDLIEEYFDQDENIQQEAKDDGENKDCLIRIYLGERESIEQQSNVYETLRNFPLRLNMMEDLGIEISELAKEMALGLAILHWQAQVDAMDVEFVHGSSATWESERAEPYVDLSATPHTVKKVNFKRRAVHLWVLDFDKATEIKLTRDDVDRRLVPAFLGNDPYYPRPHVDEDLWDEFCESYLRASELILERRNVDKQVMSLPQRFIDEVLRVSREHEDWNEEDNIVFKD